MRHDVLKIISSAKDVTSAVVLTYNVDFVFIQTVVLSALRKCGHPTLTVFADAQCAAESFAHQAPLLDSLGVRYRVVPVEMEPGFRFHPKAVLLSGEEKGTLLVGSGNLTFGGWRENAEVWARFDSETDGVGPFAEFRGYLERVVDRIPLANAVAAEVSKAFDSRTKKWFTNDAEPGTSHLVGRVGHGESLLQQMSQRIEPATIDHAVICSPYFDVEGVALERLLDAVAPARTTLLCQPSGTTLTTRAYERSRDRAELQKVSYSHADASEDGRSAFIHAKFYGFRAGDESTVFLGSANFSQAALTVPGVMGNAELLVVQRMEAAEFERAFVDELVADSEPVELTDPEEPPEGGDNGARSLRVLGARYDSGHLWIAYAPETAEVRVCEVNRVAVPFRISEAGIASATPASEPRGVVLEALVDGELTRSGHIWVDHERHLRASARGRSLVDKIRDRVQPGSWTAAAWADVMDVFCKHLADLPTGNVGPAGATGSPRSDDKELKYSFDDVFSGGYDAPVLNGLGGLLVKVEGGKERSLQQLLLRWFGVLPDTDDPGGNSEGEPDGSLEGEESVDRPERLPRTVPQIAPLEATKAEKRRIARLLSQLEEAMTSSEFLAHRSPEQLAGDIKLAAALLRTGMRESWLEPEEFFRVTRAIWNSLFFAGSPEPGLGWLEYRVRSAEDQGLFIQAMRSPDLTAALLGWALGVEVDSPSPEFARFQFSTTLAVARLPWLWSDEDPEAVERELAVLLMHTDRRSANADAIAGAVAQWWSQTLRRGHSLLRLERVLGLATPKELRPLIQTDQIRAGELLWQGRFGYCVAEHAAKRIDSENVSVLMLQGGDNTKRFRASFTVPIVGLLGDGVLPPDSALGPEPRKVLRDFATELATGFSASQS